MLRYFPCIHAKQSLEAIIEGAEAAVEATLKFCPHRLGWA